VLLNSRSNGLLNSRSNGLLNCRSNGLLNFRSDGLHVVALISVLVRSFFLSIRSNVFRRYQHSSYYDVHW
jgi:hypothetical protein